MDFLKPALVLLFVFGTVFASCSGYLNQDCTVFVATAQDKMAKANAETDVSQNYTHFTSAAIEYQKAGECLKCQASDGNAEAYLNLAIQNYIGAIDFLSPSGNSQYRGESYEYIGDVYLLLNKTQECGQYYSLAKAEFEKINGLIALSKIDAKITSLASAAVVAGPQQSPFDLFPLFAFIAVVVVIALVFMFLKKGRPAFSPGIPKQSGHGGLGHYLPPQEKPRPLPPAEPVRRIEDDESARRAKDKIKEKMRQKYGLN